MTKLRAKQLLGAAAFLSSAFACAPVVAQPSQTIEQVSAPAARGLWTPARARAWADSTGWLVGSNFGPSTAINQLEMWQADTFDPQTIDRELGWAHELGFNTARVFLHDLAWQSDPAGFKKRIDRFLEIADKHKIRPLFVFFDDCWN